MKRGREWQWAAVYVFEGGDIRIARHETRESALWHANYDLFRGVSSSPKIKRVYVVKGYAVLEP